MLDERLLQQLNTLHFMVRHNVIGRVGGRHLSKRKGLSLDFAEHRSYLPGDDYRYIDWNLYGRLDRLFVKVFSREEDYPVYVLFDLSKSMGIGNKLQRAQELAAVLGYVALKDHNRFGVYPFSQRLEVECAWLARSGWKHTLPFFDYVRQLKLAGETDFNHALNQFAHSGLARGQVIILSDMFCEAGYEEGLVALRTAGFAVLVFQLMAQQDVAPRLDYEVWLTSSERGPARRRLGGPEAVQSYLRSVTRYCTQLQEFCHHHEVGHLRLLTQLPLEQVVLEQLRGRVLR